MSYSELSITDRATIQVCLSQGLSLRAIARWMSRSPSTISRKISRNSVPGNDYRAERTQVSRLKRRRSEPPSIALRLELETAINWLIRQYLRKGTGLSLTSQEELDAISFELNIRLRKRFDFKCPIEVMNELMAKHNDAPPSIQ